MTAVATTLGVSRSNLHDRVNGSAKPRRGYQKAQDAAVLPRIERLVAERPTYGYRRITAVLNRELRLAGLPPVNHKRVYRIMRRNNLLLERSGFDRSERIHDGKVIMMRSNLRPSRQICLANRLPVSGCSDGLEFTCWNGDVIRLAFLIDTHDREIISWRAVANVGISGSDVRDMLLEAVETRFGTFRAPGVIEVLTDTGSAYRAKETRIFARQLGLKPCFTPVASPQSNGMSEAFVKTLKRDYVRVNPLPDAETVLRLIGDWIEDYNENHPHSGLKWKSPREVIRAKTETA